MNSSIFDKYGYNEGGYYSDGSCDPNSMFLKIAINESIVYGYNITCI